MTERRDWSAERFLEGRHAIVTGGGRGIGATIAAHLARAGATLTLMGRNGATLEEASRDLSSRYDAEVIGLVCDVSDSDSVASAFARAIVTFGDAQILVNNAGVAQSVSFMETSLDLWQRTLGVNLTGPFLCSRQVIPSMIEANSGRIINIASTAALRGYSHLAAYCASKHGVLGMTRSLAAEVAKHGITVNAVCPGYTEGALADQAIESIIASRNVSAAEAMEILVRNNPLNRLATQDEVAEVVTWLCSPDASGTTGQAIPVNGEVAS